MRNHCAIQQKREAVACPKPRRIGLINTMRWHVSHHQEICEAKAGNELLDIILSKGGSRTDQSGNSQLSSSPPFFSGSPPSRVSNPLIQDSRFGCENFDPISPREITILPDPTRQHNHVRVRIEGFDCLDRDSRSCSVPTLA